MSRPQTARSLWVLLVLALAWGCRQLEQPNNPYRPEEWEAPIYYSSFDEPPKHLDPAVAYSSDEYAFISMVYEPPLQYHYLKRPYELVPLLAESVPEPIYYDAQGNRLEGDPPADRVARAVYEVRIRPGIFYQPHPCFAKDAIGEPLYWDLTDADVDGYDEIADFPHTDSRELIARDFVLQLYRLADPRVSCPIYSLMENYIAGMRQVREAMQRDIQRIREERRQRVGATYDPSRDEREHPIAWITSPTRSRELRSWIGTRSGSS
ncbi:MAG: hypothetical protein KatS3mg115_0419 [Candidatus Poribacteria bacterium]|nr:MAG: hypothetical protein KatS3mg115_0419 [Candidatus Poribacteria bacterium]